MRVEELHAEEEGNLSGCKGSAEKEKCVFALIVVRKRDNNALDDPTDEGEEACE